MQYIIPGVILFSICALILAFIGGMIYLFIKDIRDGNL